MGWLELWEGGTSSKRSPNPQKLREVGCCRLPQPGSYMSRAEGQTSRQNSGNEVWLTLGVYLRPGQATTHTKVQLGQGNYDYDYDDGANATMGKELERRTV